jgi:hypothetical protein
MTLSVPELDFVAQELKAAPPRNENFLLVLEGISRARPLAS